MFSVALCILVSLIIHMTVAARLDRARAGRVVTAGEILASFLVNLAFSTTAGTFLYYLINLFTH